MREELTKGTGLGQGDTSTRCIWGKAKKGDETCEEHQRERERSMESTSWRSYDCLKVLWMCDYDICAVHCGRSGWKYIHLCTTTKFKAT